MPIMELDSLIFLKENILAVGQYAVTVMSLRISTDTGAGSIMYISVELT